MSGDFTCSHCKLTFQKGRSDEEALSESAEKYGPAPMSMLAVICEDCFQEIDKRSGGTAFPRGNSRN